MAILDTVASRTPTPDEPADVPVDGDVTRAQGGDAEAFGRLYDRYVELVYRYIYYRVGAPTLAEDLTSETFLRALRGMTSFTWQGKDFGAWLVTIARNLVADHFKSGRFRLEISTAEMLDADRVEVGPERAVLDSITAATLLETVRRLGPEQQECVVLRFLRGLSVAETALVMGKNEGAIKALQYRAVRSLARLLPTDIR
ncbi:MAG: sigma-70 family RNA polymerase sigma factor [Streptosporangiales bacterium]|nr:sigma-70 family RNA polymerase sigma factor [Streptosporangiales bacterium]